MKTYIQTQFDKLKPQAPYSPSIQIHDGQGNKTNHLNITVEQLEAIRAILNQEPTK